MAANFAAMLFAEVDGLMLPGLLPSMRYAARWIASLRSQ
jgi:hypothetical protein